MWEPQVWLDGAMIAKTKALWASDEPTMTALRAKVSAQLARTEDDLLGGGPDAKGLPSVPEGQHFFVASSLFCLLDADESGKPAVASRALKALRHWWSGSLPSDLGLGQWCLTGTMVAEGCLAHLGDDDRHWLLDRLEQWVTKLRTDQTGSGGNPHNVTNNWWAISHGGSLVAALAVHGRPAADGSTRDLGEAIHWARQRLIAFTGHFGDAGIYHEGLGYQNYTMSELLPAAIASAKDGVDFLEFFPQLRNTAAAMYLSVCLRDAVSDSPDGKRSFPAQLSWNDAGTAYGSGPWEILSIHLAHEHQKGALRWFFDRTHGVLGDGALGGEHSGWWFTPFFYPFDAEPVEPSGVLPAFACDGRQGLVLSRSDWGSPAAALLGVYSRATHVGGHAQDDAGSVRFMAHGHDWFMGGGQARAKAMWQSVVTEIDADRPKPTPCLPLIWREATDKGCVVGMDLRKSLACYAERYVASNWAADADGVVTLAMLDQIDDHRDDRDWQWNCTFERGLTCTVHDDGCGADLRAEDGVTGRLRFLGTAPAAIELDALPESTRTYAGGDRKTYPGRPWLKVRFNRASPIGIYAVLTVAPGEPPAAELLDGTDLRLGDRIWQRPFGGAVPADFVPGIGNALCPWPGGRKP